MKNERIVKIVFTILILFGIIITITNRETFNYQEVHGQAYANTSDTDVLFTPMLSSQDDIIKQTIVPSKNGLQCVEIRLANEHTELVDCTLHFSLYHENDLIWEEDVDSQNIENWKYYRLNLFRKLYTGHVYELHIQCTEDRVGIPFKVFMTSHELKESKGAYFNTTKLDNDLDIIYIYDTFPWIQFFLLILIQCLALVLCWRDVSFAIEKSEYGYVVLAILAIIYLVLIEYMCENTIDKLVDVAVIINWMMIFGLLLLFWILFRNTMFSGFIVGGILLALASVNHYILDFRGTVILPSDIYSVGTAFNVAENYQIAVDRPIIIMIVTMIIVLLLLNKANIKIERNKLRKTICVMVAMLAIVTVVSVNSQIARSLGVNTRQDNQTERSKEIGFLLNLTENLKYSFLTRPYGYSEKQVQYIYNKYRIQSSSLESEIKPNIIVIMNESFTDLRFLGNLKTDVEYMKYFNEIAESGNAKVGQCVVPVFGGGTSCSEFEFLTGCSMLFLGLGNAPYQQYIHTEKEALPEYLSKKNYMSYAVHAANPASWNRHIAYPLLGFDEFFSSKSLVFKDATYCRYWIDDESMVNEMISLYQNSKESIFEFGLTLQCHGSYDYEGYESEVHVQGMKQEYADVNQYLTLLKATDEAFGKLIGSLNESEEPTIVLMFGDHLPSLDKAFYEELESGFDDESESSVLDRYSTPYIFWANYNVDFSEIPETLSANFLAPYLLRMTGIELDEYYQYLYTLSQDFPVISRYGIKDKEGNYSVYDNLSECYERIHEYEIVQYHRLK